MPVEDQPAAEPGRSPAAPLPDRYPGAVPSDGTDAPAGSDAAEGIAPSWLSAQTRFHALLDAEQLPAALEVLREAMWCWPEVQVIRACARVLLGPMRDEGRPTPCVTGRKEEYTWLAAHGHEFPGQWLAVKGDRLLVAHPSLKELQVVLKRAFPGAFPLLWKQPIETPPEAAHYPQCQGEPWEADYTRFRTLLDTGRPRAAVEALREAVERWPEVQAFQGYARTLLAPARYSIPQGPRVTDRKEEYAWLSAHGHEYPGQWLAVQGDALLAAHTSLKELVLNLTREFPDSFPLLRKQPAGTDGGGQ